MTGALRNGFFLTPGDQVARSVAIGHYPLIVTAERWLEHAREWWIDPGLVEVAEARPLDRTEALRLAQEDQDLDAVCADLIAPVDDAGEWDKRLIWLTQAIIATQAYVQDQAETIVAELPWARPGTVDYDIEIDSVSAVRHAFDSLAALCEERRSLLARRAMRRDTTYPD